MAAFEVLALDTATPQIRAPGAADTYTFPRAITPSGANVTPFTISGYSLTGANAQSLMDLSGTWNTTGTPTGIKLNVTDTASNAASLLMNLQVGGASRFSVQKDGSVTVAGASASTFTFAGEAIYARNTANSSNLAMLSQYGIRAAANVPIGFSNSTSDVGTQDVFLYRDAANTLAQRNGVNWQAFRIYSTYTDASNYERLEIRQSGSGWFIGSNSLGTGPGNRALAITSNGQLNFGSNGGDKWLINTTGHFLANTDNSFDIGASGANRPRNVFWAGYQEMSEMTAPAAPAANSVRIYAEDNGSGKTRLMALFATGAAQQIAIEP